MNTYTNRALQALFSELYGHEGRHGIYTEHIARLAEHGTGSLEAVETKLKKINDAIGLYENWEGDKRRFASKRRYADWKKEVVTLEKERARLETKKAEKKRPDSYTMLCIYDTDERQLTIYSFLKYENYVNGGRRLKEHIEAVTGENDKQARAQEGRAHFTDFVVPSIDIEDALEISSGLSRLPECFSDMNLDINFVVMLEKPYKSTKQSDLTMPTIRRSKNVNAIIEYLKDHVNLDSNNIRRIAKRQNTSVNSIRSAVRNLTRKGYLTCTRRERQPYYMANDSFNQLFERRKAQPQPVTEERIMRPHSRKRLPFLRYIAKHGGSIDESDVIKEGFYTRKDDAYRSFLNRLADDELVEKKGKTIKITSKGSELVGKLVAK